MNRLALVTYYSEAYKFLTQHRAQHLAVGPMEPWRQATRMMNYLDIEVTRLVVAMLSDGEGCAQTEDAVNVAETRIQ